MIKATIGAVNFATCGNFRPHFTKITKIWQDRRPIRKGSIILRSRKTLFVLLHPLLFNPASQNFLYRLCGWRFLRWRQLAHSFAHAASCFRAPHHRWHIASSSSWIWTLFKKFSLEEPESEDRWPLIHTKIKKNTNANKNIKMIRASANFFREYEKFVKDTGIYKGRKDWKTGIQQKKGGICVVLIWRRPRIGPPYFSSHFMDHITQVSSSSLFPAKDSLKINRSVKMPGHRSSMRVEGCK